MGDLKKVIVLIVVFIITMGLQVVASKQKSTVLGLILPLTVLGISILILMHDLYMTRRGIEGASTYLSSFTYFSVYNVPTILFLCVYNYFQRIRL